MRSFLIILFLTLTCFKILGQNSQYVFLSKIDLKNLKISEIKTKNCNNFFSSATALEADMPPKPDDNSFSYFYFKNGILNEIQDEGERVEYRYYDAEFAKKWPNLRNEHKPKQRTVIDAALKKSLYNTNGPFIKEWEVMQKNGIAADYMYADKLTSIKTYVNNGEDYPTNSYVKFIYNNTGRLASAIDNSDPYQILFNIFFYKDNQLIGFYPAKQSIDSPLAVNADSIYNYTYIRKISKLAPPQFNDHHFSNEVAQKIIEDSYAPVKANQVMIDGLDLKQFLKKINKGDAKYIVLEVADNYFLFYKLID